MCARVVRSILPTDLGFSCATEPNSGLPRGKKSIYESKKRPKCDSTQVNPIQEVLRGYLASLSVYPLSVAICNLSLPKLSKCPSFIVQNVYPLGQREKRVKIGENKILHLKRAFLAKLECGKGTLFFPSNDFQKK